MLNLITYWRRNFKKSSAKEVYILWCKSCNRKTDNKVCEVCGEATVEDIPVEIYWCKSCNVPVIQLGSDLSKTCPHCKNKLKYAGVNVVLGLEYLKTHCKICLVMRKESDEVKVYSQVGTGNYNDKTAKIYTDLSLFTYNQKIGRDLLNVFNI